jgi:predicted nucleic acid-binding protein
MLIDTDVLIWALRGHAKAAAAIERASPRRVSLVTSIELLQGARDRREQRLIQQFLRDTGFVVLPLTEPIGHRAAIYVEQHALSHALHLADALIAATAAEHALPLLTGNAKHYQPIKEVQVKRFRP